MEWLINFLFDILKTSFTSYSVRENTSDIRKIIDYRIAFNFFANLYAKNMYAKNIAKLLVLIFIANYLTFVIGKSNRITKMMQEAKKHVVITGSGRAGTTFLIELLTKLGLDTGFQSDTVSSLKNDIAQAGLEHQINLTTSPYIVKDPSFCDYAAHTFSRVDIQIEHIFVPIRDIKSVASSRRRSEKAQWKKLSLKEKYNFLRKPYLLYGGLLGTRSYKKGVQESILIQRLFGLLLESAKFHIPVTFIAFPELVHHPEFLYKKLNPLLKNISYNNFLEKFKEVASPDLIHEY